MSAATTTAKIKPPEVYPRHYLTFGEGQRLLHLHFDFTVSSPTATKLGRDHADMIDAIARKDADAAEKLAHEHTMLFQKRFLDYMRQNMTESMALL
ncbi:hypothetical protein PPGU19_098430 (plasmid) [Paraburkholderia sp. PGU19]|nr:hypothetical protein PPGU19_098430 [Paraburkholderia sp. PGU19]